MISGFRDPGREEWFSDDVLQKAKTARLYIEHLYRSQSQSFRERRDRCDEALVESPQIFRAHHLYTHHSYHFSGD